MDKLLAFFALFRKGNVVADPQLWKHGGAALQAALVPFLLALVAAVCTVFGYCVTVSPQAAAGIAGGIVAVVGVCVTYITSDKVGLPGLAPAQPDARAPGGSPESQPRPLDPPVASEPAQPRAPDAVWRPRPGDQEAP